MSRKLNKYHIKALRHLSKYRSAMGVNVKSSKKLHKRLSIKAAAVKKAKRTDNDVSTLVTGYTTRNIFKRLRNFGGGAYFNPAGRAIRSGTTVSVTPSRAASKRLQSTMLYHELGHSQGIIAREGKGKNPKYTGKYRATRNFIAGRQDSNRFTEEVRAWKNALDMTRGTGQKRRIDVVGMRNALKSYEKGLDLPKGTADRYSKILLRYNRMKSPHLRTKVSKNKRTKGSVGTKNSTYVERKRRFVNNTVNTGNRYGIRKRHVAGAVVLGGAATYADKQRNRGSTKNKLRSKV